MGLLATIFGGSKPKPVNTAARMPRVSRDVQPVAMPEEGVRRWDAAATTRLNVHQWQHAHGNSINYDLALDREMLCARCAYEEQNNTTVAGLMDTFVSDFVGKEGPTLQVQSKNKRFNELVKKHWDAVFSDPDPGSRMHGIDMLRQCVRSLPLCGEYLIHETTTQRPGPVKLGFRVYHPRRLSTPPGISDAKTIMGITFDESTGRPTRYHIRKRETGGLMGFVDSTNNYDAISAEAMQHVFERLEPEQIRGVPWLASALPVVADLREYDKHVMEAAKNAAAQAVFWHTEHPDAEYVAVNEVHAIEYGSQQTGPPGWKPAMLDPTQPCSEYREYRHERLRDLGRPLSMPLMTVILSSADSNFASAHYDGQVYARTLQSRQGTVERQTLNRLVESVITELVLSGKTTKPSDYRLTWKWKQPPFADPRKHYEALRMQLEDGSAGYDDILEPFDRSFDEVADRRAYEAERLRDLGLPPHPTKAEPGRPPESGSDPPSNKTPAAGKNPVTAIKQEA